jgi:hypothetical protein
MPEINWKTKTLLIGAVVGGVIGLGTALLLTKNAEKQNGEGLPEISAGEALGVAVAIIGVVRGIASLGDGGSKKK